MDVGLASVPNSTSPIFIFFVTALITRHEALGSRKLFGAMPGLLGVVLAMVFLGESVTPPVAFGLFAAIAGVALINAPARPSTHPKT